MKLGGWIDTQQKGRIGMWVALGPWLIIATLLAGLIRLEAMSFLTSISIFVAFVLTWKGRVFGSLIGVLVAGLTLLFSAKTVGAPNWWHVIFVCSLLASFVITALSLLEGESAIVKNEERLSSKLQDLEEQMSSAEKAHLQDKIEQEKKREALNTELRRLMGEVDSYKNLVASANSEASKYYEQNGALKEEIMALHRRDHQVDESNEVVVNMQEENHRLQQELNHFRTLHYQKDLLAESYQERIFAHNEKLKHQRELSPEVIETLEELQADRLQAKGEYELLVEDFKEVIEKLAHEKTQELQESLHEKREELAVVRERIFKLEGEMLKTQRQLGGTAISPEEGYLAIADGECHRLEEENRFLFNLIAKMEKPE